MKMSDVIADFIGEMLSDGGGVAELQRKSLADRFSCVPSQINYVIETRFTPEHGYLVESQRGGGGFIRISVCWMTSSAHCSKRHAVSADG